MDCLVAGCNFLLRAIYHEAFTFDKDGPNYITTHCEAPAFPILHRGNSRSVSFCSTRFFLCLFGCSPSTCDVHLRQTRGQLHHDALRRREFLPELTCLRENPVVMTVFTCAVHKAAALIDASCMSHCC